MDRIIYLGEYFDSLLLDNVIKTSKGSINLSGQNFETSLIGGLSQVDPNIITVVSAPGVGSYPQYNTNLFTKRNLSYVNGITVNSVGFCNLIGVKRSSRKISMYRTLNKIIKQEDGDIHFLVVTPIKEFLEVCHFFKRKEKNRKIDITLILLDIPSDISSMVRMSKVKRLWIKNKQDKARKLASKCDKAIVLTHAMREYFLSPIDCIVMEGLFDVDRIKDFPHKEYKTDKKVILYTGTLRSIYGVMNLINAFEMGDDNKTELWICGNGDAKEAIINKSASNNRIKYLGLVNSKEALKLQVQATVLVNPRTSEGDYTKYSFPSKTIEYLLSGTPVVMNKLPGIPNEYYPYLIFPADESIEALSKAIFDVVHMNEEELEFIGTRGRSFIINNKNATFQAKRVIDFIKS